MEWIKCGDKLPDLYTYVLVLADNQGTDEPKPISIAKLTSYSLGSEFYICDWEFSNHIPVMPNYGAWHDMDYTMNSDHVTHWMPLPKPPQLDFAMN